MTENDGTAAKFGRISLWLVTLAFGLAITGAGATKFTSSASWLGLFADWGYPPALSYVIGVLEIVGGLAFFVPRFATYAGALISAIMLVAVVTLVTHPGEMGPLVPVVNIVVFTTVAWSRRAVRWRPGQS
jgi:uncharacterized membrane protein YphA (DoxX/SURF4 family)